MTSTLESLEKLHAMTPEERARLEYGRDAERKAYEQWAAMPQHERDQYTAEWEASQ